MDSLDHAKMQSVNHENNQDQMSLPKLPAIKLWTSQGSFWNGIDCARTRWFKIILNSSFGTSTRSHSRHIMLSTCISFVVSLMTSHYQNLTKTFSISTLRLLQKSKDSWHHNQIQAIPIWMQQSPSSSLFTRQKITIHLWKNIWLSWCATLPVRWMLHAATTWCSTSRSGWSAILSKIQQNYEGRAIINQTILFTG